MCIRDSFYIFGAAFSFAVLAAVGPNGVAGILPGVDSDIAGMSRVMILLFFPLGYAGVIAFHAWAKRRAKLEHEENEMGSYNAEGYVWPKDSLQGAIRLTDMEIEALCEKVEEVATLTGWHPDVIYSELHSRFGVSIYDGR